MFVLNQAYVIYHLNLAFSSLEENRRPEIIKRSYWPLLNMADTLDISLGIELTGWTLAEIKKIDPAWVSYFADLLASGRCELIGSGWSQMIGPLVPHQVNCQNQKLGLQAYQNTLGLRPSIALVNEMAFSSGLVDIYKEAGYRGVIMDRDNVRLARRLERKPIASTPHRAKSAGGDYLPLLWGDSVLFQRLQRVVHGDIGRHEYFEYIQRRLKQDKMPLPLYCNDAEVFDTRPGRFETESAIHGDGEWERMGRIFKQLETELNLQWLSPSEALSVLDKKATKPQNLTSTAIPIPVKKQAKYNINRWAATGRDDVWLNTCCFRIARELENNPMLNDIEWRNLCELWASDFRTHITSDRWQALLTRMRLTLTRLALTDPALHAAAKNGIEPSRLSPAEVERDEEGVVLTAKTQSMQLDLNLRRGLAIKQLGFASHGFHPLIGTLSQGYFNNIAFGADFYSGGVVVEDIVKRRRMTDLESVNPEFHDAPDFLGIGAHIKMGKASLDKRYEIGRLREYIKIAYEFQALNRPLGSVRLGVLTLLPENWDGQITVTCRNGGSSSEVFPLNESTHHSGPAMAMVSSTSALGATDGEISLRDQSGKGLSISWDPGSCAAVPMLTHLPTGSHHLTRLGFSLGELDDTSRADGRLLPFTLEISPLTGW